MIPMIDLNREMLYLKDAIQFSINDVLDSGIYVLGERVEALEKRIANYTNTTFGIGLANGTDALLLALKALGICAGDEVITTAFTFVATAEAIALTGATPVFVDIDPHTYNIDPDLIRKAITPRTKAIIVVHLYGRAAEMTTILEIAQRHNIKVIEDACQALGTEYGGHKAGSLGAIGCFSFYPSKNLGAFGDGGMVVTNDKDLHEKICELRNHGSRQRYVHSSIGINSRLDELQAAVLLVKMNYLDLFLERRRSIAERYTTELSPFAKTPSIFKDRGHTFHQYCIEIDHRADMQQYLKEKLISTAVYYPIPLHLQEAFAYLNYKNGDLPVTETISARILALPIFPTMTSDEQEYIIAAIRDYYLVN